MGMMEGSLTTIAPILLRNMLTSIFIYADKSLLNLGERYKLLEFIRHLVATFFLFFLRLLPSLFPHLNPFQVDAYTFKSAKGDSFLPAISGGAADSGIARALSQLLAIVNDIPVSSRKYEIVRSLAERLIDENQKENVEALREVNRTVLSAAFSRTLTQLEAAMVELTATDGVVPVPESSGHAPVQNGLYRVVRMVRSARDGMFTRLWRAKEEVNRSRICAEKLAAELLWLAQKMAACGFAVEAVEKWAWASNLAWLALSAEPRLQGSLVKVSAFLFKQAKNMGPEESEEDRRKSIETKMKILMSWLPLLCRASNGTDSPVLSTSERLELEKTLEEIIEELGGEEVQEQVLSLWLHHFTHCPSSDWPNLLTSYARWCTASRKLLLLR